MLEIQVLVWDRHKNEAWLNQLMGSQFWITTAIQLLTNDNKSTQILSYSKRPHPTTKMNDNIKMDRTIAGSMK
jgi:hypothetical protein